MKLHKLLGDPHLNHIWDTKLVAKIPGCNNAKCICDAYKHLSWFVMLINVYRIHVWQSRIEIEYYSVAYFERITEFDML